MPQLAAASQGALNDACAAFPASPLVPSVNLHFLVAAVEGLLRISDYQRRRILQVWFPILCHADILLSQCIPLHVLPTVSLW